MAQKNCSKCGKAFECCNEASGCWCENLHVESKMLEQLKNEFDNCLCQACLLAYAAEPKTGA